MSHVSSPREGITVAYAPYSKYDSELDGDASFKARAEFVCDVHDPNSSQRTRVMATEIAFPFVLRRRIRHLSSVASTVAPASFRTDRSDFTCLSVCICLSLSYSKVETKVLHI